MPADRSGDVDAVVIGSGPNGLVAANVLADHGWDVLVLEAAAEPGGAVRSAEVTAPGFTSDLYSAFYPLAAVSPALRALDLDRHGLRWSSAPRPLAHPTPDGPTLVIDPDLDVTAASLDRFAPGRGDGDTWRALFAVFDRVSPALFDALLTPFPPVRPAVRLAGLAGPQGLVDVLQLGLGSARGRRTGASRARAVRCCSAATRSTPTCCPSRPAAPSTGGCSSSRSRWAGPSPWAAPASSPPPWCGDSRRTVGASSAVRG